MKLTAQELAELLSTKETSSPLSEEREPRAHGVDRLQKTLETLWGKIPTESETKREIRTHWLDLLKWLAAKNGWEYKTNTSVRYRNQKSDLVDGRLFFCIKDNQNRVAGFELCFEQNLDSLAKLDQAAKLGMHTYLLWAGHPGKAHADTGSRLKVVPKFNAEQQHNK